MSPYSINKLIYEMTPETVQKMKENLGEVCDKYGLTDGERKALHLAVHEDRYKTLHEIGVLPNLLFRFARHFGFGPGQFADLMKR